ncbi:MAG: integrase, partial [Micavibrio aeruginosavorus]
YCRAIFAYGKVKGYLTHNPADIKASDILSPQTKGHYAAMEAAELPRFLCKLHSNEGRLFRQTQIAMELMLLTFVRTSEMIKAKWEEVDFDQAIWTVPVARMKMKRHDHIVPLSKRAVALLAELHTVNGNRSYVFPSQRNPREHMSNNTLLVALRNMGYAGIHTGHGFRALAMTTIMEELGYPFEIPDTQLSHSKGSAVRAAYDRTKYLKERTKMMEDWSGYIEQLINKTTLLEVRPNGKG